MFGRGALVAAEATPLKSARMKQSNLMAFMVAKAGVLVRREVSTHVGRNQSPVQSHKTRPAIGRLFDELRRRRLTFLETFREKGLLGFDFCKLQRPAEMTGGSALVIHAKFKLTEHRVQ